jgi:hypothetical protein
MASRLSVVHIGQTRQQITAIPARAQLSGRLAVRLGIGPSRLDLDPGFLGVEFMPVRLAGAGR